MQGSRSRREVKDVPPAWRDSFLFLLFSDDKYQEERVQGKIA